MICTPEPLAGACLRPLGHLSVAPSYKAKGLVRKGKSRPPHFVLVPAILQSLAEGSGNEMALGGMSRTPAVQPVRQTFWRMRC